MHSQKTESNDSSRAEFWDMRYAAGETPWDFHGVPAALKEFLKTSQAGSVLIPGCGAAYEVRAFHEADWKVTANDFGSRHFDFIYERTFLCALPPDLWPAYVNRMTQLLRPGGKLVGIFLYGEQAEPPPYPLNPEKAREVFKEKFSLAKTSPVSDSLPMFAGN